MKKRPRLRLRLDVFNILDAQTNDITYFYTSRLAGEPAEGVDDVHFHPGEPRSFDTSVIAERKKRANAGERVIAVAAREFEEGVAGARR
jgi:hypothetical protein